VHDGVNRLDRGVGDSHSSRCIEETTKQFVWDRQFQNRSGVWPSGERGVSDQSQHHIQIDLEHDGGTESIKVKAIYILRNGILDQHPMGVIFNPIERLRVESLVRKRVGCS